MKPSGSPESSRSTNPFDPAAEAAFVDSVLRGDLQASDDLAMRLACVPRILANRNAKFGRPLTSEELDDLAQDACLVVLRRLRDYRPFAPFESWIYGICVFLLQDAMRRKGRERRRAATLDVDPQDPSQEALTRISDAAEAEAALTQLPLVEAQVLSLKHLDGLTFIEIGARLHLSPNTAKTLYYRGVSKLRTQLAGASAATPSSTAEDDDAAAR
jgi:RNA polymerase sigma factor (sigma-70 family)